MIRIGIVGTGYEIGIAQMHIMAYQQMPDVSITAVYDNQAGRAAEYISRFKLECAQDCASYEELLEKVDAVSICTPNDSHVELVEKAIRAKRHVLCEKPFAPTPEACQPLVKMAEDSGLVCMIGLCYRGIPGYRYLKKMIESGELGAVRYLRASLGGGRIASPQVELEWRMQKSLSGPGAAADFGSHLLDMADWLMQGNGGPIREVYCMEGTFLPQRKRQDTGQMADVTNDDVAVFVARTQEGVLCNFTASRIGCQHTIEILGEKGLAVFDGNDVFSIGLVKADEKGAINGAPVKMPVPEELYLTDEHVPKHPFVINFYHETREFVDAITKGGQVETDFARGVYIQQLIQALQQSADTGCKVQIEQNELSH